MEGLQMNNLKTLEDITLFSVVEDEREEEERETDEIAELIDIRKIDVKNYEKYLIRKNMAENTIKSYTWTVRNFFKRYNRIDRKSVV